MSNNEQHDRAFDPSALMGLASSFMGQQGQQGGQGGQGGQGASRPAAAGGMDMGAILSMASSAMAGAQGGHGNAPSGGQQGGQQGGGGGGLGSLLGALGGGGGHQSAPPAQSSGGGLGSLLGAAMGGGGGGGSHGGSSGGSAGGGLDIGALMGLASSFAGGKAGSGGSGGGGGLDVKTLIKLASTFKGGSGGSGGNASMFSTVASSLMSREVDLSAPAAAPDAATLQQAHQRTTDPSSTVGANDIGGAAAVHAMQSILGNNQGQPDAGAKNNLVAAAMSHASDLWEKKSQNGQAQGTKDEAVYKAGEYAMSLFSQQGSQPSHASGGGEYGAGPTTAFPEPGAGHNQGGFGGHGHQGGYGGYQ